MRDLSRYPVTHAEKLNLLEDLLCAQAAKTFSADPPIGDMTGVILSAIKTDVIAHANLMEGQRKIP